MARKNMIKSKSPGKEIYEKALTLARLKSADLSEVRRLLEEATELGFGPATYALATWYLFGKTVVEDHKKAVELLQKAVALGEASAMFDLAVCFENGAGVKRNVRKSIEFYVMAALHGDKQAMRAVGRCYWHGIGRATDRTMAKIWLDRADEL